VRAQLAARRQHREHRAMHARDRLEQRHRLRAQRVRRRQEVIVPLVNLGT
jgi:hypothetical protein